ncbi:MAG: domain S-box [Verrucomicrobiaceae bacterium]|nr:domain S-box [Verrucomicrobiaceae bacterium]
MKQQTTWLKSARFLAMPLAMFAVVTAVTLLTLTQLLQILRDADLVRFNDELGRMAKPLEDAVKRIGEPVESIRKQAVLGNTPAAPEEWRQRAPFVFDFGYARRVKKGGKEAFVVEYIDSRQPDSRFHVGDDLASVPALLEGIEKARKSTRPDASPYFEAYGRRCTLFVSPGYKDDNRPHSDAEAEERFVGIAFAVTDTAKLFEIASQDFSKLLVYKVLEDGEPRVHEPMKRTSNRGLNGYTFHIRCEPGPSFYQAPQHRLPNIQLVGGLVLALLLSAWQLRQRFALDRVIATRTAELVKANERLEGALAREQEVSELKSNFISTVSHEFRTPLGVILSSNGILKNYLDRLPAASRAEHFHAIDKAVSRMTEMVEDVLLFSRAEANRLEFNPRPMNPGGFSRLIVDEVNSATEQKCVIEKLNSELPETMVADEKLLRPILRNLLENAVKYSPPGGMVKFTTGMQAGRLIFEIADQGIGIPQADQAGLGEAFARAKNAQDIKGTGLGLAIVQRCVQKHGGTLRIDSTEGEGTTFHVELPAV